MPKAIEISASSMTGLLGAVEASKSAHSRANKSTSKTTGDGGTDDIYNISRYKKGSALTKNSSKSKDYSERTFKNSNKGVKSRAMKDKLDSKAPRMSAKPPSVQEQLAMEALERKSKIYEATIRGQKGGLSEKQLEACPLDIDAKRANLDAQGFLGQHDSDSENSDQSVEEVSRTTYIGSSSLPPTSFTGRLSSAQDLPSRSTALGEQETEEEEWIESKDEFGRDILIPASKLKTSTLDPQRTMAFAQTESARDLQDIGAHYGAQTDFPVQDPSDRPIRKSTADEPIEKYFDAKAERRQLGTAFYALSSNPEERQRQQEELRAREEQTKQARTAANSLPDQQLSAAEIALETRKRMLQAKKEELARKRMKKSEDTSVGPSTASIASKKPSPAGSPDQ
ncbi:hypothetical protein MJO28_001128 [Puccinia striiformis f. sp. tritici]|uniref:Uncharacterized protein n=4 Tax=Puccinia striiformis TaxID=27350 RepID=A0A0L0VBB2_9BASI|nr:hypothetical protein Pst134EA_000113 [Puccinia striiformis f. sp. tritici]KAI9599883.1 hypothetical protein KEM48_000475 [Puccinia striiformis f. sp. tritici PST-130]KNE96565.1 hypothetical protein PSTG_10124 [Puccinia striiformis f. sp. tritici PST-78]POW08433.1 hypothetical protein PSTT_07564 [Puccinia striiformis]KAH9466251.1 hypothetical protein Pst134EB_001309 [Puccinia striiformis f. sp. tritici]KAH9473035.1 hypothetical protein Pst134EA_000113 [Puccinia striiformis f. sp. tritici]